MSSPESNEPPNPFADMLDGPDDPIAKLRRAQSEARREQEEALSARNGELFGKFSLKFVFFATGLFCGMAGACYLVGLLLGYAPNVNTSQTAMAAIFAAGGFLIGILSCFPAFYQLGYHPSANAKFASRLRYHLASVLKEILGSATVFGLVGGAIGIVVSSRKTVGDAECAYCVIGGITGAIVAAFVSYKLLRLDRTLANTVVVQTEFPPTPRD